MCSLNADEAVVTQQAKPLLSPAYMGVWGLGAESKWASVYCRRAVLGCHTSEACHRSERKTQRERGKGSETQRLKIEAKGVRLQAGFRDQVPDKGQVRQSPARGSFPPSKAKETLQGDDQGSANAPS